MNCITLHSRAQVGLEAPPVAVETYVGGGLPSFRIVGLPETAVKESRDRVRAAIQNSGFRFPDGRITVNLAPADLPKQGGRFDLPIALGVLAASDQLRVDPQRLDACEFYGELSLAGALRAFPGALPASLAARDAARTLVVPLASAEEAALVSDARVMPVEQLSELVACLRGQRHELLYVADAGETPVVYPDLADVRGQHQSRRAVEIAAAGGHSLLMFGPPGTGKSMLAMRLPGLLPPMTEAESLETAAVHSIALGRFERAQWRQRPFRAPHHTASAVALAGGGTCPRPGEVSLAHNGVLFLDELPEFPRHVLDVMRQPLESGVVSISRAAGRAVYPACFQLVAAMNPCPCGHLGDRERQCLCSALQIRRYRERLSGPLLDRIDLHVEVGRPPRELLRPDAPPGESTTEVATRVRTARDCQLDRAGVCNARLGEGDTHKHCAPTPPALALLETAMEELVLSARAYQRILRVARTVADLAGDDRIEPDHIGEAINLRRLDRRHDT